jgi:hypothetical protein
MLMSKEDTMKNLGIPCSNVDIFGMGYGGGSSCEFSLLKTVRNRTVPSFFGIMKQCEVHGESTSGVMTPMSTNLLIPVFTVATQT